MNEIPKGLQFRSIVQGSKYENEKVETQNNGFIQSSEHAMPGENIRGLTQVIKRNPADEEKKCRELALPSKINSMNQF